MRRQFRIWMAVLVVTVPLGACSEDTTVFDPGHEAAGTVTALAAAPAADCPDAGDLCYEIAAIVAAICPQDSVYEKRNDYRKCVRNTFDDAIAPHRSCFKGNEIKAIRDCVDVVLEGVIAESLPHRSNDLRYSELPAGDDDR